MVGGALLHELTAHLFVLLLEQRLDLARFVHKLLFVDGNGWVAPEDVLELSLAIQLVAENVIIIMIILDGARG